MVITFVIIPTEYLQSDRPLETSFFMDILMGRKYTNKKTSSFFFLPKHCDCICEKLHPILYLCNTDPCLALWGSAPMVGGGGGGNPSLKVEAALSVTL